MHVQMKLDRCRHIFGMILGGMTLLIASCDNEAVSVVQEESFLKYYALSAEDNTGTKVIRRPDGYAIMCNVENSGQEDILVVFTDRFGRRTGESDPIGDPQLNDHGYSMINLDEGYLICGTTYYDGFTKGYLVNISGDGAILWEKRYLGYAGLEFRDVVLHDGNLVMTGSAIRDDPEDTEVPLFKTNARGDSSWLKTIDYSGNDVVESIMEFDTLYHVVVTNSGTQVIILYSTVDGRLPQPCFLEEEHLSGRDIIFNPAGRIFVLAKKMDPVDRVSMIYLAELELIKKPGGKVLELLTSAIIPDPDGGSLDPASFIPVGGDELVIGGSWQKTTQSDRDILFMEVDNNNFQPMDKKTFGAKSDQESLDIIATPDGGYALTGSVNLGLKKTTMLLKINQDKELK
jgi:hypothetical protein